MEGPRRKQAPHTILLRHERSDGVDSTDGCVRNESNRNNQRDGNQTEQYGVLIPNSATLGVGPGGNSGNEPNKHISSFLFVV